jgi:hypothetical protein
VLAAIALACMLAQPALADSAPDPPKARQAQWLDELLERFRVDRFQQEGTEATESSDEEPGVPDVRVQLHPLGDANGDGRAEMLRETVLFESDLDSDEDYYHWPMPASTTLEAIEIPSGEVLWSLSLDKYEFWTPFGQLDGDDCIDLASIEIEGLDDLYYERFELPLTFWRCADGSKLFEAEVGISGSSSSTATGSTFHEVITDIVPREGWHGMERRIIETTGTFTGVSDGAAVLYGYAGQVEYQSRIEIESLSADGTTRARASRSFPDHLAVIADASDLTGDGVADSVLSTVQPGSQEFGVDVLLVGAGASYSENQMEVVLIDGASLDVRWSWTGTKFMGNSYAVSAGPDQVLAIETGYESADHFATLGTRYTFLDAASGAPVSSRRYVDESRVAVEFGDVDHDGRLELLEAVRPIRSEPGFSWSRGSLTERVIQRDGSIVWASRSESFPVWMYGDDPADLLAEVSFLEDYTEDGVPDILRNGQYGPEDYYGEYGYRNFYGSELELISGADASVVWKSESSKDARYTGEIQLVPESVDLVELKLLSPSKEPDGIAQYTLSVLDGKDLGQMWTANLSLASLSGSGYGIQTAGDIDADGVSELLFTVRRNPCEDDRDSAACKASPGPEYEEFIHSGVDGHQIWPIVPPPVNTSTPTPEPTVTPASAAEQHGSGSSPAPSFVAIACFLGFAALWARKRR